MTFEADLKLTRGHKFLSDKSPVYQTYGLSYASTLTTVAVSSKHSPTYEPKNLSALVPLSLFSSSLSATSSSLQ